LTVADATEEGLGTPAAVGTPAATAATGLLGTRVFFTRGIGCGCVGRIGVEKFLLAGFTSNTWHLVAPHCPKQVWVST
jgi:hypothetical protein